MTDQLNEVYHKLANHWSVEFFNVPNKDISLLIVLLSIILIIIVSAILGGLIAWGINHDDISIDTWATVALGFATVFIFAYFYAFSYRANNVIKTALGNNKNEIIKSVYQHTVLNHKNRFETKKWIYNAKIVYNQNIGKNKLNDDKLNSEIFNQKQNVKKINHDLHKLNYINHAAKLKLTYGTAKKLYPDINENPDTNEHYISKIKPSQLSDKKLQKDIESSLKQK